MDRRTWGWIGPISGIRFVVVATIAVILVGEIDPDPDDHVVRGASRRSATEYGQTNGAPNELPPAFAFGRPLGTPLVGYLRPFRLSPGCVTRWR